MNFSQTRFNVTKFVTQKYYLSYPNESKYAVVLGRNIHTTLVIFTKYYKHTIARKEVK